MLPIKRGTEYTPHKLAVYLLVGRPAMALETIRNFRDKTSGSLRNSPIYAFYFPGAVSVEQQIALQKCSDGVIVKETTPPLPRFAEGEMFYSRKSDYAKRFPKSRLGFLDMCYWASNPRLEPELDDYDYLLRIDDDSEFLGDCGVEVDKWMESDSVFGTARTWSSFTKSTLETREKLFQFTQQYCSRFGVTPKSALLNDVLQRQDEEGFHGLEWSVGNFNLYDNRIFSTPTWDHYIRNVQEFGGAHRYRWGDIEVIGLFVYLYIGTKPKDLGLVKSGAYIEKKSGASYIGPSPTILKLREITERFYGNIR